MLSNPSKTLRRRCARLYLSLVVTTIGGIIKRPTTRHNRECSPLHPLCWHYSQAARNKSFIWHWASFDPFTNRPDFLWSLMRFCCCCCYCRRHLRPPCGRCVPQNRTTLLPKQQGKIMSHTNLPKKVIDCLDKRRHLNAEMLLSTIYTSSSSSKMPAKEKKIIMEIILGIRGVCLCVTEILSSVDIWPRPSVVRISIQAHRQTHQTGNQWWESIIQVVHKMDIEPVKRQAPVIGFSQNHYHHLHPAPNHLPCLFAFLRVIHGSFDYYFR